MGINLELRLLGTPQIEINGEYSSVSPPAAFELLCLIIFSGEAGISRKAASLRLWSHLEPKNAMAQLRFNLMKLRDHDVFASILNLDTNHLMVVPQVNISVDINRATAPSAIELPNFIQPICSLWNKEHWQDVTDMYATKLAGWIEELGDEVAIHSVQEAHLCFPDSFLLATQLVGRLQYSRRLTEATEVVIRFEDAWVERFGVADIPSILISGKPDSQIASEVSPTSILQHQTHPEPPRAGSTFTAEVESKSLFGVSQPLAILLLVSIACLFSTVVAVGFALNRTKVKESQLKLAVAEVKQESGFEISKIRVEGADPRDFSPLARVSQYPIIQFRDQLFQVEHSGRISPLYTAQWIPLHLLGTTKMEVSLDSSLLKISTPSDSYTIHPTKHFPFFDGTMVVGDGCVVYNRLCGHPFRDHRKLCYWKNGTEIPIHLSTPEPQNAVVTCRTARGFFGKYSMGKSDGWKYHAFYFDFQSQKTQMLDTPPVIAELGDSVLVRPERTDVVNGDYRNHPLDYALVIDKSGRQKRISLATHEDVVGIFGGYIYICRKKTQFTSDLEFLNFDLKRVNPFPSLPKEVESFGVRTEDVAICVGFDHNHTTKDLLLLSKS
jgi:hypothetical protein